MRNTPINQLSVILAFLAGLAAILGLLTYNRLAWRYGVNEMAVLLIAFIVSSVTFVMALTGLHLHKKYSYSRKKASLIGAVFGAIAFLLSVIIAMVFMFNPKGYDDALTVALATGFVLGGFLGPLVGALVGFKRAR